MAQTDQLGMLLERYRRALDAAERLPVVTWLPWQTHGVRARLRAPHVRAFLARFMVVHMRRTLADLRMRHGLRLAVDGAAEEADPDARAIRADRAL